MDPAVGLLRSLPIIQPGKAPGMLQGVPIVEDFTAPHKHLAPVPDPLGSIPHNHYHGVSRVQPAQLAQLRIQAREDGVGIPQATPQKATHHRMASGRGFHPFAGQQQHPGFDLLEWALLHRWQGRKRLGTRAPPALLTRTCMPNMLPSTLSTTAGGASRAEAPSLRLSAWYRLIPSL